ncbi:helix-turn-helix domain-containing protein [Microbacterium invictum]|uniref:Helix-turn-helix domain-containing protein n=1 Tax=Microbacterium invictum TaxID=515415 RepID=A0ABZ0VBB2_9MICO|nr:helix-turn-helix domain-containing protein [Microbacterium invictum]WQB70509.1 helix-turn-helix domain-containing protein [Microbacterium invictum]
MAGAAGRPRTSDAAIIEGARRALIENPRASMAEIARSAGVGMSAIYLRFPNRVAILRHFADEANAVYDDVLDAVEQQMTGNADPRVVLHHFVAAIVDSGVHRLVIAIAGTFIRTDEDIAESTRLRDRGRLFIRHLHLRRALRPGVTWEDLGKLIEALSSIRGADDQRTAAFHRRAIDVVVTGLTAGDQPLVGDPADATDFRENRPPESPTHENNDTRLRLLPTPPHTDSPDDPSPS